jgi:hypothetical protein
MIMTTSPNDSFSAASNRSPDAKAGAKLSGNASQSNSDRPELAPWSHARFSDLALEALRRRTAPPVLSEKDRQIMACGVIDQLRQESLPPIGIDGLPDPLAPFVDRPIKPADLTVPGALFAHVVALEDYEHRIEVKLDELSSPSLFGGFLARWTRLDMHGTMRLIRGIRNKISWWTAEPMIRADKMGEKIRADKVTRQSLRKNAGNSIAKTSGSSTEVKRSHDFD